MAIKITLQNNRRNLVTISDKHKIIAGEHDATTIRVQYPDEYEAYSKRVDILNDKGEKWTHALYTPEFQEYEIDFNRSIFNFKLPDNVTLPGEIYLQFIAYDTAQHILTPFDAVVLAVEKGIMYAKKQAQDNPDLIVKSYEHSRWAVDAVTSRLEHLQEVEKTVTEVSAEAVQSAEQAKALIAQAESAVQTSMQNATDAQASAENAERSASESATASAKSQKAAQGAKRSADKAAVSASNAEASASDANERADNAEQSARTAEERATLSAEQANMASEHALNAEQSAKASYDAAESALGAANQAAISASESANASANALVESLKAQQSASNAEVSAQNAEQSATASQAQATASANSAINAEHSASNAEQKASESASSASVAEQKAIESANSAEQALAKATDAESLVRQAQQSAENAEQSARTAQAQATESNQHAESANASAEQSAQSATIAQEKVTTAEASATQSAQSATLAQQSAQSAEESATQANAKASVSESAATSASNSAEQSANSASEAQIKAENAEISANSAQLSAEYAQQSATTASNSATASATSASEALVRAENAEASALKAQEAVERVAELGGYAPPTDKGAENFLAGDGEYKPIPQSGNNSSSNAKYVPEGTADKPLIVDRTDEGIFVRIFGEFAPTSFYLYYYNDDHSVYGHFSVDAWGNEGYINHDTGYFDFYCQSGDMMKLDWTQNGLTLTIGDQVFDLPDTKLINHEVTMSFYAWSGNPPELQVTMLDKEHVLVDGRRLHIMDDQQYKDLHGHGNKRFLDNLNYSSIDPTSVDHNPAIQGQSQRVSREDHKHAERNYLANPLGGWALGAGGIGTCEIDFGEYVSSPKIKLVNGKYFIFGSMNGFYAMSDDMKTWEKILPPGNTNRYIYNFWHFKGFYYMSNSSGGVWRSTDARIWVSNGTGTSSSNWMFEIGNTLYCVNRNIFSGYATVVYRSTNGTSWSQYSITSASNTNFITEFKGKLVFANYYGEVKVSDGQSTQSVVSGVSATNGFVLNGKLFMLGSSNSWDSQNTLTAYVSDDGETFTAVTTNLPESHRLDSITVLDGIAYAGIYTGNSSVLFKTTNGLNWEQVPLADMAFSWDRNLWTIGTTLYLCQAWSNRVRLAMIETGNPIQTKHIQNKAITLDKLGDDVLASFGGGEGAKTGEVREFSRLLTSAEEDDSKVVRADGRLLSDDPKYQSLKNFLMNAENAGDFVIKDLGVSRIVWTAFPTGDGEIYWTPNWDNNDNSTKNHMIVTDESGEFLRLEDFPEISSAWSNWNFRFRAGDWIFACSGYRGVQKFNVKTKEKLIYPLPYTENAAEIFLAGNKVFYFAPTFALGTIWVLDVNSLEFQAVTVPEQAYRLPVVQGDSLYMIGGPQGFQNPTTANTVIRINLKTLAVTEYAYPESGMALGTAIYHPTRQAYIFPRTTASTSLQVFQVYAGSPMWGTISSLPPRVHNTLMTFENSVYVTSGSSGDTTIVELAFTNYWGQIITQHTVNSGTYGYPKIVGTDIYYNSGNYTSGTIPIMVFDTLGKSLRGQLTTPAQRESFVFRNQVYVYAVSATNLAVLPLSKIDPTTLQLIPVTIPGLPASWRFNTVNTPEPGLFYTHWNEGTSQVNSSKILIGVHQTPKLDGRKYLQL